MRGDSGLAYEGKVVGVSKFHFWGKCTMSLTSINSDWKSNASSGLCIILVLYYWIYITWVLYFASLGVIIYVNPLIRIFGCNDCQT